MSDDIDRAQEREQEMRQDATAEQARRAQTEAGDSALFCAVCEEEIPDARRKAVPGVQTCIACKEELEEAFRRR